MPLDVLSKGLDLHEKVLRWVHAKVSYGNVESYGPLPHRNATVTRGQLYEIDGTISFTVCPNVPEEFPATSIGRRDGGMFVPLELFPGGIVAPQ